jgi:uncharacterized membrane protein YagU involved in acid resistance
MDISAALTVYGLFYKIVPLRLLQGVASGALGQSAYQGGVPVAALGMLCHFVIAFGAATAYYLVSRKMRFLIDQAELCGVLYGIIVYFAMQNLILPLSRAAPRPFNYRSMIVGLAIHMCCVGMPIALGVRRWGQ